MGGGTRSRLKLAVSIPNKPCNTVLLDRTANSFYQSEPCTKVLSDRKTSRFYPNEPCTKVPGTIVERKASSFYPNEPCTKVLLDLLGR